MWDPYLGRKWVKEIVDVVDVKTIDGWPRQNIVVSDQKEKNSLVSEKNKTKKNTKRKKQVKEI